MNNKENIINSIIASSGGKINRNAVEQAANGNTNALLSALSQADRQKLEALLKDEEATKKLLSSEAAQSIIRKLGRG